MDTKALALVEPRTLTPDVWSMIQSVAPAIYTARMFGVSSPQAAAAVMLKGWELGFGLTASFEFIKNIQGKPELIPRGALALLHDNPKIEKIEIRRLTDNKGAYVGHECFIRRKSGFEYTARFTIADAQRAGLVKPDSGYSNYPENMCLWRAVGFAADVAASDILLGATNIMKAPEQYGVQVTSEGDVIEGQFTTTPNGHKPTLIDLTERYGAEAVMNANGGNIPGTDDEIAIVAEKLATTTQ